MPITRLALPLGDTERPVPVWALRLAKALPFVVLPHCLWRLPFAVDFTMGQVDPHRPPMPWWAPGYVVGLSVLTEALCLLTTGLVAAGASCSRAGSRSPAAVRCPHSPP